MNELRDFTKYDRYLAGSEVVVYTCRRHPIVLGHAVGIWLATLLGALVAGVIFTESPDDPGAIGSLAAIAVGVMSLYLAVQIGEWWVDEYVITNKRVMKLEGILTRKVSTIPLGKITDTAYRRSVLGRLIGYGDLVLDLPGQDKSLPVLNKLTKPDEVYKTIISIAMGGGPPAPPPRPKPPSEEDTGPIPVVE